MFPSSSGQGHQPLKLETEIRILLGTPIYPRMNASKFIGFYRNEHFAIMIKNVEQR